MTRFWNNTKTALLLGALMGLFLLVGSYWGQSGLLIALILGGGVNLFAFFFSDKLAIAAMKGREVDAQTGGDLYRIVQELSARAQLPMPRVYLCPHEAPNAFATGRSPRKAAVAVTQGLMQVMNRDELEGVIAHELAHIKNRDTLISTIAATIAGLLGYLANMAQFGLMFGGGNREGGAGNALFALFGAMIAALGAALIQAMISRSREFVADADGARIAGKPNGLASALHKLEHFSKQIPLHQPNPAQNNLFIVEPFLGRGFNGLGRLFATHPPTEARIRALMGG